MPDTRVTAQQKQAVFARAKGCCEFGLTPIARATIESLKLNREELVNLRGVLNAMGEHPPEEES